MEPINQGSTLYVPLNYPSMPNNLKKAIYQKKASSYQFTRGKGTKIEERDRQWILRLYYCLKGYDKFLDSLDSEIIEFIAMCASCSVNSIKSIIMSGISVKEDKR